MSSVLTIERLGAQGDGVAETPAGPVFVPFTLPGETVTAAVVKGRADLLAVREASPSRVPPACRHFGTCGGCALQHMEEVAYRAWKRDKVVQALNGLDLGVETDTLVSCAPHSRRRVTFAVRKTADGVVLGYNQALSHHIVAIEECPIASPRIVAALENLRKLAGIVAGSAKPFRMTVTDTISGLDVALGDCGKIAENDRLAAADFTLKTGFARLSADGEVIVEGKAPLVAFGDIRVAPPPGAFLQAVETAEQTMAALIAGHLERAKNTVDLFSGSGAFALRLAREHKVHAVEGDGTALAALDRAVRRAERLKPLSTERRDLFRRPLTARELDAFDGLVFDPPRAGAKEQAAQIARSKMRAVAAVSCNPATLARDLAILIEGGYRVRRIAPIDQFLWSPHVEVVALLEKPSTRR